MNGKVGLASPSSLDSPASFASFASCKTYARHPAKAGENLGVGGYFFLARPMPVLAPEQEKLFLRKLRARRAPRPCFFQLILWRKRLAARWGTGGKALSPHPPERLSRKCAIFNASQPGPLCAPASQRFALDVGGALEPMV